MDRSSHVLFSAFRPMLPRDINETHRAATPLELFFDLVVVIAIAAAAAELHHALSHAHFAEGIIRFGLAFFAIWLAWLNYTWFASAYDNDDTLFRCLTMVIMAGSLTLAAGIRPFFTSSDMHLMVTGFVIMRVGMVILWLRAAKNDPDRRQTAITYAAGIALAQVYWVALMLNQPTTDSGLAGLFVLGGCLELVIPVVAERVGATPWHRHHMIERYGLLNIIVLGETLLAGSLAIAAMDRRAFNADLFTLTLAALVILFSLWWLYFSKEEHMQGRTRSLAFTWGYGHLVIYMAGAATGAGFAVMVDIATQNAQVSERAGHFAVAIPVSLYLLGLWFVRDRFIFEGMPKFLLPGFAMLILLAACYLSIEWVAMLVAICVYIRNRQVCKKFSGNGTSAGR